jgi:hypothetical protein
MQSNKFLKIARIVARRDKALFDALMEFEETGRIRSKTRLNFTVDRSVASRFKKLCKNKGYNMSAKIEQAMTDALKKQE